MAERPQDAAGSRRGDRRSAATAGLRIAYQAARLLVRAIDWTLWTFIRALRAFVIGGVALGASLTLVVAVATWEVSRGLPEDSVGLIDGRERGSVTVLDRNGELLGQRGHRFRPITVAEAGPVLIDAILSTEDRRFYWHIGVDPIGLTRALLVNWRAGAVEQGGSSITQQVAKLAFLSNERSISRKLQELPLSLALEWAYTKDEILEIYLNRAYLGAGTYGFNAASNFYFNKAPGDLSHAEAALLAGLLKAPSRWSPLNNFDAAQDRARVILNAMLDAERISPLDHRAAHDQIAFLRPPVITERSPYFVDWIADQIPLEFWEREPDLILTTTLDPEAQAGAEAAVARVFDNAVRRRDRTAQAAMVILSTDGAVRAMVGGRDYAASQFNRAASARRQLGSAFKPFVFAAALEAGLSLDSRVNDSPVTIGDWSPRNYANSYRGWVTLSTALARSSNVAAVRLGQTARISNVVGMARRFGFAGEIPAVPSLPLGVIESNVLEVAAGYAVFANNGQVTPPFGVTEIKSQDGRLLWTRRPPPPRQAISEQHARWMQSMMNAVVERGTARRARLGPILVAGKTGTTQDYRDAWFAGFTGDYVAAAWMGHDDFRRMRNVTGGSFPAQMWREAMAPLHQQDSASESMLAAAAPAERSGQAFYAPGADRRPQILGRQGARERVRAPAGRAQAPAATQQRQRQRQATRQTQPSRAERAAAARRAESERQQLQARERRRRAVEEVRQRRRAQAEAAIIQRRTRREAQRQNGRIVITRRRDQGAVRARPRQGAVITRRRDVTSPSGWRR